MPLSALCCLGVMQISSGCLSRLNRDQNRRWSNRYTAGRRSAATERTENTQTVKYVQRSASHKYIHLNMYAVIYTKTRNTDTLQLYINVLVNPMPSLRPAERTKLQLLVNSTQKKQKNDKYSQGGERPQQREHNRSTLTLK